MGLIIWTLLSRRLFVATTTKQNLGHLAPASGVAGSLTLPYHINGMVFPPATSEAGARWPKFGLVVVATTCRRDNKVQMIRPYERIKGKQSRADCYVVNTQKWLWSRNEKF
jgi:hypothetical protein